MKDQFLSMPMGQTFFIEINGTLTEIKFKNASINLKNGVTTYSVMLPDGTIHQINSSAGSCQRFYSNPKSYMDKRTYAEHSSSLHQICRKLNIPVHMQHNENGELVSYNFYVWVIEEGFAREKIIPIETIEINNIDEYSIDMTLPNEYYTEQYSAEKLHKVKVINKDGHESSVGGELTSILPSDSQKELIKEFCDICHRMKEANVKIITSESTMTVLAVNGAEIDYVYGYENCEDDIELSPGSVPHLIIPKLPIYVCNDYDSEQLWFNLKNQN